MEGRACRDTGLLEGKTMGTPSPDTVSTKRQRIARGERSPWPDEPDAGNPHVRICGRGGVEAPG
jgi:hypothetical protein